MTRSKAKGTRRERIVLDFLRSRGLRAHRAGNNLPSKDLELEASGFRFAVEVKDRQQLNLHGTIVDVTRRWPDQLGVVVWHRTKLSGSKQVPMGPTIVAMTLEDFTRLVGGDNANLGPAEGDASEGSSEEGTVES